MSKKKAHHYVPRFYLKNFSIENLGKHIGIYNKKKRKYIGVGDLRHQAYIKNYYDDNGEVENILSTIEQEASEVIRLFLEHKVLPVPNHPAEKILRIFTLVSLARTKSSGDEFNNIATKFFREVYKHDSRFNGELEHLRVENKFPTSHILAETVKHLNTIDDLKLQAIVNLTETPFITSDNPVILYNQFLESGEFPLSGTGLGMKGLEIFYPLHPRVSLFFYDAEIYQTLEDPSDLIWTEDKKDINQLNLLQFLNSDENLYFDEEISVDDIYALENNALNFEQKEKSYLKELNTSSELNKGKKLLLQSRNDIKINLSLSLIKTQEKYVRFENKIYRSHFLKVKDTEHSHPQNYR